MKIHSLFAFAGRLLLLIPFIAAAPLGAAADCQMASDHVTERLGAAHLNHCPLANAGMPLPITAGDTVVLNASASSDVDGDELAYRWRIIDAPLGSSALIADANAVRTSFTPDLDGDYLLELSVKDASGGFSVDALHLSTRGTAPVARAGNDRTVELGSVVSLDGIGSFDMDGAVLDYRWQLRERPAASQARIDGAGRADSTLRLDAAGDYVAELIVSDGQLDSVVDAVRISTANSKPTAHAGRPRTFASGSTLQLDSARSVDIDGDNLSYQWSILSQPAASDIALSDAGRPNPNTYLKAEGLYVFQLIVSDGKLFSDPATVLVEVDNRRLHNVNPDDYRHLTQRGMGDDTDGDGVPDPDDNCVLASNATQIDSDGDGIGNACDADLNNDGVVNFIDLGILRSVFFTTDPEADFNGDGIVNFIDLGILRSRFFLPPGPAGTIIWVSLVDGDFANRLNWEPQIVPSAGSLALIDVAPAVTVTALSDAIEVKGLVNNETLVLSGGSFTATDALENGGSVQVLSHTLSDTQIIPSQAASGTLEITSGTSTWSNVLLDVATTVQNAAFANVSGFLEINSIATILAPSSPTGLRFNDGAVLQGTGAVVFDSAGNTVVSEPQLFPFNGTTMTIAPGMTVRGSKGRVGQSFGNIVVNGSVSADIDGETIQLFGTLMAGNGSLTAANGGAIEMSGIFDNAGGVFAIDGTDGSISALNGLQLRNTTLNATPGTDFFFPAGNYTFTNLLYNGDMTLLNAANANVLNLTLNGRLLIDAPSSPTGLVFIDTQTFGGNAVVEIDGVGNSVISEPRLFPANSTTLTIASTVHVRGGKGTIGQAFGNLVFEGTLDADLNGEQIRIGGTTWSADNTLTASNGGSIELFGNMTNGGSMLAIDTADGGLSLANGAQVRNATLNGTPGSNLVIPSGTYTWEASTLNIDSTLENSASVAVLSGLTMNSAMQINAPSSPTGLTFNNTQTLDGTGTITIDGTGNSVISEPRLFPANSTTLTVGPNITVRGGNGRIGQPFGNLVFNGTLISELPGAQLEIGGTSWSASQLLQATSGARIEMFGSLDNAGGSFNLDTASGSSALQVSGSLRNATINGTAGTNIEMEAGITNLVGMTITADLTHNNGARSNVLDGLTLNGTATVNGPTSPTGYLFNASQSLLGNATFVFAGTTNPVISEQSLFPANSTTLTVGPNVRIEGGAATIGQPFGNIALGDSIVDANVGASTLRVVGTLWSASGTLAASNGGALELGGNFDNGNNAVTLDIAGGSASTNSSTALRNATINATAGSNLALGTSNTLESLVYAGDMTLPNGSQANVFGGLTLNGTATIVSTSSPTGLQFVNEQTLGGNATIIFDSANPVLSEPRIFPSNSVELTVGPNVVVRGGNASVGQPFGSVVMQGTVIAESGQIDVFVSSIATGDYAATDSATLNFRNALNGGGGALTVDPLSTINFVSPLTMDPSTVIDFNIDATGSGQVTAPTITHDGTANISAINGYAPSGGETFSITSTPGSNNGSGAFATVNSFGLGGGLSFGVTYDANGNASASVN